MKPVSIDISGNKFEPFVIVRDRRSESWSHQRQRVSGVIWNYLVFTIPWRPSALLWNYVHNFQELSDLQFSRAASTRRFSPCIFLAPSSMKL